MKVVCESCQAKYQVPDARVAGKKLKIRCKRCGATVLIRGDLAASDGAQDEPSIAPVDSASASGMDVPLEWHVSLDGETRGPYSTEELRAWLSSSPSAWDAHVWREGFPDWIEARACAELGTAPLVAAASPFDPVHEDEGPTKTFEAASFVAAPFMARAARGGRGADTRASAVRTRTANGGLAAAGSSPHLDAEGALTGERHEDSVLFSAQGLQTMASAPAYTPGPNPGFAGGEGSGLIDIRALASLARQSQARIANPSAANGGEPSVNESGGLSFGNEEEEDARAALMNQPSSFGRIDSLAPISNTTQTSNVAVPLAILGGCALVAAAVFAAILIARPSRPNNDAMATPAPQAQQEQDPLAAAARPTESAEGSPGAQPPGEDSAATAAAGETRAMMPGESSAPSASGDESADALAKKGRAPRSPRTAADEKKAVPEEKAKPKKEEKSEPPGSDEVMLAEKAKPKPQTPPPAAEPKPEKTSGSNATADLDQLLAAKPVPKPAKSGGNSIDELMSGAVDKGAPKSAAPAPAPAATAAADSDGPDLPDSPSRDETLAAMRGVESAVRACATGQNITGTATVEITISGSTGRVSTANVTGITGPVGSCIARAVRMAKFPHFTKPSFGIKYPYRF